MIEGNSTGTYLNRVGTVLKYIRCDIRGSHMVAELLVYRSSGVPYIRGEVSVQPSVASKTSTRTLKCLNHGCIA